MGGYQRVRPHKGMCYSSTYDRLLPQYYHAYMAGSVETSTNQRLGTLGTATHTLIPNHV